MRITRSGLRRIIAEESARILAEANDERVPGGHLMRIAAGFENEPAEVDFEDEDEDEDEDDYTYGDDPEEFLDLPAGEIQRRLRDLDEGEGHQVSSRKKLGRFLATHGVDDEAVFKVINAVVARAEETGAEVTSEDITFNLDDEIIDALPEDEADAWHGMLEDILADEIDPDAFADAEAHRKDIRDTERSLDREEGLSDYGDDDTEGGDDYDDGGDWYLEEGDGGDYDYDYEDEPEAEMGDPEDPYGDLPKGEHPRGGLVHTAGFKGDSPAGSLLRRREEFPEHPSGLTGMGGPYSEYDHLHYGAGINEARWAKLAGVLKD
jgi:phosphohistidine phosphatase SixA